MCYVTHKLKFEAAALDVISAVQLNPEKWLQNALPLVTYICNTQSVSPRQYVQGAVQYILNRNCLLLLSSSVGIVGASVAKLHRIV